MKNKKQTLNEELNRMSQIFSVLGQPIRLTEATVTPGSKTALSALDGASTMARYLGTEGIQSVEASVLRAARNSDEIVNKTGKEFISSFDDLKSLGATKYEIAENVFKSLNSAQAKTLADELANTVKLKNTQKIKSIETTYSAKIKSEGEGISTELTALSKKLDEYSGEALDLLSSELPGLRTKMSGIKDTNLKTEIDELLDGVESQINTKKMSEGSEGTPTTKLDYENPFKSTDNLKGIVDQNITIIKNTLIDVGVNATQEMIDKATDFVSKLGLDGTEKLYNDMELAFAGGTLRNAGGPSELDADNALYGFQKFDMNANGGQGFKKAGQGFKKGVDWAIEDKPGSINPLRSRIVRISLIVVTILTIIALYNYDWSGLSEKALEKTKDVFTPDTKDVNCVQELPGYNSIGERFQNFVGREFGCEYTKDDSTYRIEGFELIGNELYVYFDGGCKERYTERTPGDIILVPGSENCRGGSVDTGSGNEEPEETTIETPDQGEEGALDDPDEL
jgi:hypothetical protein